MRNDDYNATLWAMSAEDLVDYLASQPRQGANYKVALNVMEAKTLVAQERAIVAQERASVAQEKALVAQEATARWTKWLVIATFVLIVVTALISIAATVDDDGADNDAHAAVSSA